jgi:predicted aspartyl protease
MKPRLIALSLLAAAAAPSAGREAAPEAAAVLDFDEDRTERMTVPVTIDGSGPYDFIVDTGAERTAIARELAEDLRLQPGTRARLYSTTDVRSIVTVHIPELGVGGRAVKRINAPALERRNMGAEGILGVDTLQQQRVSFDFVRRQMTVTPSRKREEKWPDDTIVVTARNRYGHLVLVDASVDGQKVWVILDTGGQTSVGNSALRRKLEAKGRLGAVRAIELLGVTGTTMPAEQALVGRLRLGNMDIHQLPVAFADAHPFRKLGLMDRPALLLGMDALKLFERVSVDFPNRTVKLLAPSRSELGGTKLAAGPAAVPG